MTCYQRLQQDPENHGVATVVINEIASSSEAQIHESGHCRDQKHNRGIDTIDVDRCLRHGTVHEVREPDPPEHPDYRYRVCRPGEDRAISVVVAVLDEQSLALISTYAGGC